MKPTKNRMFCRECNRPKILFEEEKQALNFLKFNTGEYEEQVPLRAYCCNACMGWHITSKEGESYINPMVDKVINQYRRLLGTYSEEVIKMSNTALSECGTLKKDMKLSPKIIRKKFRKLLQIRSILAASLTTHEFALIEKTVNETFAIVERRYGSMEELEI